MAAVGLNSGPLAFASLSSSSLSSSSGVCWTSAGFWALPYPRGDGLGEWWSVGGEFVEVMDADWEANSPHMNIESIEQGNDNKNNNINNNNINVTQIIQRGAGDKATTPLGGWEGCCCLLLFLSTELERTDGRPSGR